jgi:hypothetical protein
VINHKETLGARGEGEGVVKGRTFFLFFMIRILEK